MQQLAIAFVDDNAFESHGKKCEEKITKIIKKESIRAGEQYDSDSSDDGLTKFRLSLTFVSMDEDKILPVFLEELFLEFFDFSFNKIGNEDYRIPDHQFIEKMQANKLDTATETEVKDKHKEVKITKSSPFPGF